MQDYYDFSVGDRVMIGGVDDETWTVTRVWSTGKVEMRSNMTGAYGATHARNLIYA